MKRRRNVLNWVGFAIVLIAYSSTNVMLRNHAWDPYHRSGECRSEVINMRPRKYLSAFLCIGLSQAADHKASIRASAEAANGATAAAGRGTCCSSPGRRATGASRR